MAGKGKIKCMIEKIISERSRGSEALAKVVRTKLILKGIQPERYTDQSEDDPKIIRKLEKMLRNLNECNGRAIHGHQDCIFREENDG